MEDFIPLTPSLRQDINKGIDITIEGLKACKPNGLAAVQIEALGMYKTLIRGLPDGFPMPIRK